MTQNGQEASARVPYLVVSGRAAKRFFTFSPQDWQFTVAFWSVSLLLADTVSFALIVLSFLLWIGFMWRWHRGRTFNLIYDRGERVFLALNKGVIYNPNKPSRFRHPPFGMSPGSIWVPPKNGEALQETGVIHQPNEGTDSIIIRYSGSPYSGADALEKSEAQRRLAKVLASARALVNHEIGVQQVRRLRPVNPNPQYAFELSGAIQGDIFLPEAYARFDNPLEGKQYESLPSQDELAFRQHLYMKDIWRITQIATFEPGAYYKITMKRPNALRRALKGASVTARELNRTSIIAMGNQLVRDLQSQGFAGVELLGLCDIHDWMRTGWDTDLTEYRELQRHGVIPTNDAVARKMIQEAVASGHKEPYQKVFQHWPEVEIRAFADHLTIGKKYFATLEIVGRSERIRSDYYDSIYNVRTGPSCVTVVGQTLSGKKESKMVVAGISMYGHLDRMGGQKVYVSSAERHRKQQWAQQEEMMSFNTVGQSSTYLIIISGDSEDDLIEQEAHYKTAARLVDIELERVTGLEYQWRYFKAGTYASTDI